MIASVLTPVVNQQSGRLKYIAGDPLVGLSGLIIPPKHPEWVLANGALLPNSGIYAVLFAIVGAKFGPAGTLPNFLDGVLPIPKGASAFPAVGAAGGEVSHVLTLAEYPNHSHSAKDNQGPARGNNLNGYSNIDGYNPYTNGSQGDPTRNKLSSAGGSVAHNNMPLYFVGGYVVVKL